MATIAGFAGAAVGILFALKPLTDLFKILISFASIGLFRLVRSAKFLIEAITILGIITIKKLKDGWDILKSGFRKFIDFAKELPGKIWAFIKELPGKIWEFMKAGFNFVKDKIVEWSGKLVEGIKTLWEGAKGLLVKGIERGKALFIKLKEFAIDFKNKLKILPGMIWTKLKEGFNFVKDKLTVLINKIVGLPQLIWNKLKGLAVLLADAIKDVLPFSKKKVGDAIIRPNGDVIETDPRDTLVATQNPNSLGGGGGNTFVFNGVTPQEMIDVIRRELGTDINSISRF